LFSEEFNYVKSRGYENKMLSSLNNQLVDNIIFKRVLSLKDWVLSLNNNNNNNNNKYNNFSFQIYSIIYHTTIV
jgi:hypothetical protein